MLIFRLPLVISLADNCAPYTDEFDCNFDARLRWCARYAVDAEWQ